MTEADLVADASPVAAESRFISAPDGLRLHVRSYRPAGASGSPVVCLPGLARTEADFEALAIRLASDAAHPRRVLALDYRGRGASAYDPNWQNYDLATELADVAAVLTALAIDRAVFVGTSRGGLITMLLAAARPALIAGAILNDIGPVIEPKGLIRIKGYIGKTPVPKDFAEGSTVLRRLFSAQFPSLTEDEWLAWAKRNWAQQPGGLVPSYDVNLAKTLKDVGPDNPAPVLWAQFDALAPVPVMVIHGDLSDVLSSETVAEMARRRPDLEVVEVFEQGHAPLLAEAPVLDRIAAFIGRCDEPATKRADADRHPEIHAH